MTEHSGRAIAATPFASPYRVRFDEAGPDGLLRTSGLLRYAQDVAWLHSETYGFDREWYGRRRLGWLVRAGVLEVVQPIPMGTRLTVSTAVIGWRKVWARRRSEVRLPDGALAAWVHTDWVLIDDRGAPTRIPPDFGEVFPSEPATEPITRVALPDAPADAARRMFTVRPHEVDPNDHVNNACYLDWLEEALVGCGSEAASATAVRPRRYAIEYLAAVAAGAVLESTTWRDDAGWAFRVDGPDGASRFRGRLAR